MYFGTLDGSRSVSTQNRVSLAQLVERRSHNPEVVSSILTGGTSFGKNKPPENTVELFGENS
jgi:hypothetical protein